MAATAMKRAVPSMFMAHPTGNTNRDTRGSIFSRSMDLRDKGNAAALQQALAGELFSPDKYDGTDHGERT